MGKDAVATTPAVGGGGSGWGLVHGQRLERLVGGELQAAAQQLGVGGRRQAERAAVSTAPALGPATPRAPLVRFVQIRARVRTRVARLAAAQRRRWSLHVRVVHGEVLLNHPVHGHGGFREVRQVTCRHVAVGNETFG